MELHAGTNKSHRIQASGIGTIHACLSQPSDACPLLVVHFQADGFGNCISYPTLVTLASTCTGDSKNLAPAFHWTRGVDGLALVRCLFLSLPLPLLLEIAWPL